MMHELVATNITKAYRNRPVIDHFDLRLTSGEIVMLVGESGTGKTTLMRALNNLERIDNGTIRMDTDVLCEERSGGVVYADRSKQRRYQQRIGMVFQDYQLFPNLTVRDNLLEAPLAQAVSDKQMLEARANTLLEQVGLRDQATVYPRTLSGGQQQRVAIARALMLAPDFLCFDEPTSALDDVATQTIGCLLTDLRASGKGILVVTHDNQFAQTFGTRRVHSRTFLSK